MNKRSQTDPSGPVILVGLGKVGFSILRLLGNLQIPVVVITRNVPPDWEKPAERLAGRFIRGDGRSDEVLLEAGIQSARAIIITTNDDLINLEILLDAQRLAPDTPIVVRMLDARLAQRVARDFKVRAALNAAEIATAAFVAAALGEDLLRAFEVEGKSLHVVSRTWSDGAPSSLSEICSDERRAVVGLKRAGAEMELLPDSSALVTRGDDVVFVETRGRHRRRKSAGTHLADPWIHPRVTPLTFLWEALKHGAGPLRWVMATLVAVILLSVVIFHSTMSLSWVDSLYFTFTIISTVGFGDIHLGSAPTWVKLYGCLLMVTGVSMVVFVYGLFTDFLIRMRVEEAFGQKRSALANHVIVAGGGELGARVASQLHGLGVPVIVVEKDPDSAAVQSPEIPVLAGDATNAATLDRAGVARARAVVAVTDDDMTNLRIAQETEEVNLSARTVVRLFRSRLAAKMGASLLGMDVPLNPSEAAAATFVACALEPDVLQGFTLDGSLLVLKKVQARDRGITEPCRCSQVEGVRGSVLLLKSDSDGGYHSPDAHAEMRPEDWLVVLEEHSRHAS